MTAMKIATTDAETAQAIPVILKKRYTTFFTT